MYECSKALMRRIHDHRFVTRYFLGNGIDIGAGPDPLGSYREMFPGMKSCRSWDLKDGDAQLCSTVQDATMDFVHSSHCLEHMVDPLKALENWIRILKPGGHLVIVIPDEDLYEQGIFPSTFNSDHKWTFTLSKKTSWSPRSINAIEMANAVADRMQVIKMELLDATFYYHGVPRFDQTLTPVGECAIELIMRKWTATEQTRKGRLPPTESSKATEAPRHAAALV